MSSSWPCLFFLVCFLITQTPVPVPGAVSAGSCATTYSNPDIVFSRPSNASRVATMFTMFWLYIAWFSRTALFEVGSKNGDFAKYGSTEVHCQNAIFRSRRTQGFAVNYLNSSVCPSFVAPMPESAIGFRPKADPKPLSP